MSITGLYTGARALQANQIAIEITGQNISNVNTEGYTRQRANLATTIPLEYSYGILGTGVRVNGIERIRDAYLDTEIENQTSTYYKYATQADYYDRLENIFNEPSELGIDSMLSNFFSALSEVSNSPEDIGIRDSLMIEAQTLTNQIQFVNNKLDQLRLDIDGSVKQSVTEVNSLTSEIGDLNKQIVKMESGTTNAANDLRDTRDQKLKALAQLVDITTFEQDTGAVNVNIDGINIVFGSTVQALSTELKEGDELPVHDVIVESSGKVLNLTGGEIGGYLAARDTNITSYVSQLDNLARGLIDEINKLHVGGQGIDGYSTLTSQNAVSDSSTALASAGLDITPVDTTFEIDVYDSGSDSTTTVSISIDVSADSLDDVATSINSALSSAGITEVSAAVGANNKLAITSSDSDFTFSFSNVTDDSSNFLSALGMNTFFTGTDASDIAINQTLIDDPQFFAAAQSGADGDNTNVLAMTDLRTSDVMDSNTRTIEGYYQSMIVNLGAASRQSQIQRDVSEGYLTQLTLKRESISGVNLDEEAANLIRYQRAYEASARYIGVVDQLLNVLVNGLV